MASRLCGLRLVDRCVLFLFIVAVIGGCTPQRPAPPAMPPPPVTVAKPVVQTVADYEVTTGRADAYEAVDVRARVSGYLQKVTFHHADGRQSPGDSSPKQLREGDTVEAGTLLCEIDPRPYQAVYDAATADSDRAKAALDRLSADLARAENLRKTNNISVEEFDKISAQKAEAAATVAAAAAQIDAAKLNLEFTQVKAPITGRLGRALVTEGNLVTADVTLLTTIVREDPIYIYFDLSEQVMLRYKKLITENKFESAREQELPVDIGLANEDGFPHRGVVDFVDNRVDVPTATLKLRGRFANPELNKSIRALTPGMFVRVRIPASKPYEALLVGERAILTDQGEKVVFTVDADGTTHRRVVELGTLHGRLRVVTAGLKPDERIVVNGLQRVRDGAKVDPHDGPMPGAESVPTEKAEK